MTRQIEVSGITIPPEIVDDLTRRDFLVAAGLLALVPGCGSGGESDTEEASGETRTVEHALGTTEVPVNVERVVTLSPSETEIAIALGLAPVGAVVADLAEGFPGHLGDATKEIEMVGTYSEPNLEAVARLDPDIIAGPVQFVELIREELEEIGATIATPPRSEWKTGTLPLMGEVMGKTDETERFLAEYNGRIAELREAVGGRPEEITISVIANFSGQVAVYLKRSPAGIVLDDVGFSRPPIQDELLVDGSDFIEISEERIPDIDADAIFFVVSDEEMFEETRNRPVWKRLDAVRQGNVFRADNAHWFTGGPLSAREIMNDLEKHLVEGN